MHASSSDLPRPHFTDGEIEAREVTSIGSRVESGLELRFPELGRHQALGIEPGRDQPGRYVLRSKFLKILLTTGKGFKSHRPVSLGQRWVPQSDKDSEEKPGGRWAQ